MYDTPAIKYYFRKVVDYRDDTGVITSQIEVELNGIIKTLETQYNPEFHKIPVGTPVSIEIIGYFVKITIHDDFDHVMFYTLVKCPFCQTLLLNIDTGLSGQLYCCNPRCSSDIYGKFFYVFSILSIAVTKEQLDYIFNLNPLTYTPNILDLVEIMQQEIIRDDIVDICRAVIMAITNLTPSMFLKILSIPIIYDEYIQMFDMVFNTLEEFVNAMQNYKSLYGVLPHYDADIMAAIYSNMQLNHQFIRHLMRMRRLL